MARFYVVVTFKALMPTVRLQDFALREQGQWGSSAVRSSSVGQAFMGLDKHHVTVDMHHLLLQPHMVRHST